MTRAVEIMGPWLHNKGDVLMLHAVRQRLPDTVVPAVSSSLGLPTLPPEPALHEVRLAPQVRALWQATRHVKPRTAMRLLRPERVAGAGGRVRGRDVAALLDCSGYVYGDPWPLRRARRRIDYYRRLRDQGARLVLLPQALGPFDKPDVAMTIRTLLGLFDLVFARDETSRRHVLELGMDPARVELAPDVTTGLDVPVPVDQGTWSSRVCLVPNARMLDRTSSEVAAAYVDFMLAVVRACEARHLEACLVVHEDNDIDLARELQSRSGAELFHDDALVTKGYLGAAHAVVGSRFHALVGALSQSTPCIGTTWGHKYEELFTSFGCADMIMSPTDGDAAIAHQLDRLSDRESRNALVHRLGGVAAGNREQLTRMWDRIYGLAGI